MPQQNDYSYFSSDEFVSDIDYSEVSHILDLTTTKQKQLRRSKRPQSLLRPLLLKRTHTHICQLLDSECTISKPLPLSPIDTNKRKLSAIDNYELPSQPMKKSKSLVDNDILQFLRELNAVKVTPRSKFSDKIKFFSTPSNSYCSSNEQNMPIVFVV